MHSPDSYATRQEPHQQQHASFFSPPQPIHNAHILSLDGGRTTEATLIFRSFSALQTPHAPRLFFFGHKPHLFLTLLSMSHHWQCGHGSPPFWCLNPDKCLTSTFASNACSLSILSHIWDTTSTPSAVSNFLSGDLAWISHIISRYLAGCSFPILCFSVPSSWQHLHFLLSSCRKPLLCPHSTDDPRPCLRSMPCHPNAFGLSFQQSFIGSNRTPSFNSPILCLCAHVCE